MVEMVSALRGRGSPGPGSSLPVLLGVKHLGKWPGVREAPRQDDLGHCMGYGVSGNLSLGNAPERI